jgi:hypothetical protein
MTTARKYRYYECYNVRIFLDTLHTCGLHTLVLNLLERNRTNFYCRFSVLVVVVVVVVVVLGLGLGLGLGLQELKWYKFYMSKTCCK